MRELFVSGRLCLFGEHSDWAGGYRREDPELSPGHCLVAGTDQGLYAEVEARTGGASNIEFDSCLPDGSRRSATFADIRPEALEREARAGGFFRYAAGTAACVRERHDVGGLALRIVRSDLPIASGLSSSAAVCVLVARAYSRVYELGLTLDEEMEFAFRGERLTGSECGRMDQICAYGSRTVALAFDGDELEIETLEPRDEVAILIVDLCRGKDTPRILADLNACFPNTAGPLAAAVRDALGPRNAGILSRARQYVSAADAPALGSLMTEAQALFDESVAPACPALEAPRLHAVLASSAAAELAYGGKGVGSQGDGCAQFVTRGSEERSALAARLQAEFDVRCFPLTLRPSR